MRRIELDIDEIVRLYTEEGLRSPGIASRMGCSDATILSRLHESGVICSSRSRLPREEVTRLYIEDRVPLSRLGERFGVAGATVARHLRDWGVPLRSPLDAHQPPGRRPCPRSRVFRSYMFGFVAGDMAVNRVTPSGGTVLVRTNTTKPAQARLIRDLFAPFGPVRQSGLTHCASLDLSFLFLLEKYNECVPTWISGAEAEAAFAAGYTDAEGSFGTYQNRARFKVDSYDMHVLAWLASWAERNGIRVRRRRVGTKGAGRPDGTRYTSDLWRVNVNDGLSILRLAATLDPFLRHRDRRTAMDAARANVLERLSLRARRDHTE